MTRSRLAPTVIAMAVATLALTGCMGNAGALAHPSPSMTSRAAEPASVGTSQPFVIPTPSSGELARVLVDGSAAVQTVGTSVETSGQITTLSVLFQCVGQNDPMEYSVYIDGTLSWTSSGLGCDGQNHQDTSQMTLTGHHQVRLTVKPAAESSTRAYAILVRND